MTINHYTDFANAEKYAANYDAIISLGHYMPEKFREGKKYLMLDFEDETFGSIEFNHENLKYAPKDYHIRQIIDFIRALKESDKLLIHCFAGYSRSSAVTIIARCERDKLTFNQALENLMDHRIPDKFQPHPNDVIIHEYLMTKI